MSDLEEDLLALAAGGDFDSQEEESDNEALNSNRGKSSGAQRKKKKVLQVDDDEHMNDDDIDDNGDEDGYEFDDEDEEEDDDYDPEAVYVEDNVTFEESNPYPLEGKYKSEKDRLELEEMGDVERESILFERAQELQRFNERRLLAQRARQNEAQKHRSSRSKKVKESAKSVKSSKLSELKRQRERKSKREREYDDESDEEAEEDDDYNLGDEDEEDNYEPDFTTHGGEIEWAESTTKRVVGLNDINSIRTGHSIAEKYCFYPGFDEAMVGTFGKIRVSSTQHRMVKIDAVVRGKPYQLNDRSKLKTDQYFTLSQPGKDRKNFPVTFLSDEPIKQSEFDKYNEYILDAQNAGKRASLPSTYEIDDKYRQLKSFSSQRLEGETFEVFMRAKSKFNQTASTGTNILDRKLQLKTRLLEAQDRNDHAEVNQLAKKLAEVERKFQKVNTNKVTDNSITAKISEKNRRLNNVSIRQAELKNADKRKLATSLNSDPFARLTTKARMYYQDTKKSENDKAKDAALKSAEELARKEAEKQELLKASTYRKLGEIDKIISRIDFTFDFAI
ncbi:hypothetical protein WICMUC_000984 [Wickerhamomyces mucosus]|uniref:Plus3 domain-containing protein n=1 Tax=Wickerhamomyces mucosus TaxID=1378264 RepID=A0A9P8PY85_9ASCO|nr:hypothetical protein WICMUC_000984 [Wickerhamomyces mucosus]